MDEESKWMVKQDKREDGRQMGLSRNQSEGAQTTTPEQATLRLRPSAKEKKRSRSRTIAPKRLTREEVRIGQLLADHTLEDRPRTRAECENGIRPCPYVSCKHHLY